MSEEWDAPITSEGVVDTNFKLNRSLLKSLPHERAGCSCSGQCAAQQKSRSQGMREADLKGVRIPTNLEHTLAQNHG